MNYRTIIEGLTREQRAELISRGINKARISDWISGRRLPTRAQALMLADVTGADWVDLAAELTLLEAGEEHRPTLAAVLGRALQASSLAKALSVLVAVIVSATMTAENAYASTAYDVARQADQTLH